MENHLNWSEVPEALAGGLGVIDRYNETVTIPFCYLALPVIRDLTQATKSLAIGELSLRVSVAVSGQYEELSNHFNQTANRIETQIHEISCERNLRDSILSKMVERGLLIDDSQFAITYANSAAIAILDFPVHYQVLSSD